MTSLTKHVNVVNMGYHHGDLRNALVQAGLELLDEAGIDHLTLRAAARAAEVSSAAPYRHFRDRPALLAAIAAAAFRDLVDELDRIEERFEGFARVTALGEIYDTYARLHPARFRLMFGRELAGHEAHEELRDAAREAYGRLRDAVDRCGLAVLHVDVVTDLCWACVHGVATLNIDGQLDAQRAASVRDLLGKVLATCWGEPGGD